MRSFVFLACVLGFSPLLTAVSQEPKQAVKPGELIVLTLADDLAVDFARLNQSIRKDDRPEGLEIKMMARVEQVSADGKIRFGALELFKDKDRLITLSGTIEASRLEQRTISKGTARYADPGEHERRIAPALTTEDRKQFELTLRNPKDLTMRAWVPEKPAAE